MKKLSLRLLACWLMCWSMLSMAQTPDAARFDVLEYVVEGNTVLAPDLVERALMPYMGPGRSLKDIEAAREALEKAYQDAGFLSVVVSLPNQQLGVSGEVRLEVTQASIERLSVTGAQYHLPSKIKQAMPSVAPGQVPYFPDVQTELGQVQTGHMQVTPLLSGGSQPDKLLMELQVQDSAPFSASLELDNRQSFNTSRGRLAALVSYGNLFQAGHRLSMSWQYAPWRPKDTNSLSLIYGLPLGSQDTLSASLTISDSDTPVRVGEGGNTLSKGETLGLRWQHELPARQWPVQHGVSVALDHKNNRDQTELVGVINTPKPALRYLVMSLGYNLNWQGKQNETLSAGTTAVVSGGGLSAREVDCDGVPKDQFECKRFRARSDFMAWKFEFDWVGPLLGNWRVSLHADGQLASGPLVSGEQYSLGGPDTVRGYYDFEQAGDEGWRTRVELLSPTRQWAPGWRLSGLAFWDRGYVSLQNALEGQIERANLGSVGLGLRASQTAWGTQLSLDVARPTFETQRAESDGLATTTRRQWRAHVGLRQMF